jgi:hypothetical protein
MNKKNKSFINWKMMPIEDKVLFIMEGLCYLLVLCTLGATVYALSKNATIGAIILIVSAWGLMACGLSARGSREFYLNKKRRTIKLNNREAKQAIELELI